jgi:signal transduction histidine kinase
MRGVAEVDSIVAKSMEWSEQYLDYTVPFALIAGDFSVIFQSKGFRAAQDSDGRLLEDMILIVNELLQSKANRVYDHERGIECCKVATIRSGRCIFYACLDDDDVRYSHDLERHHHDLHGPIRNIASFLHLIKRHVEAADIRKIDEYTGLALNSVRALNELNEHMLSVGLSGRNTPVNLVAVVNDIRCLLSTQLATAGCTISVDGAIPLVSGNYVCVLRILKNLIENSLQHSRADRLAISLRLLSRTSKSVSILFEDNGADVTSEIKEAISNALRSRDTSAGFLGLRICRGLMNSIHGDIQVVMEKPSCCYELVFKIWKGENVT